MSTLKTAFSKLSGREPERLKEWEIAHWLMANWDVPKLGEDLARRVIFRIVNHVVFPSRVLTTEIVIQAERNATELFSEFDGVTDEPHMAQIAYLENVYSRGL